MLQCYSRLLHSVTVDCYIVLQWSVTVLQWSVTQYYTRILSVTLGSYIMLHQCYMEAILSDRVR